MSLRLHPSRVLPVLDGVRRDILIIFSGWEVHNWYRYGTLLPKTIDIPAVGLWNDCEAVWPIIVGSGGAQLKATGIYGILGSNENDVCPIPDNVSIAPIMSSTLTLAWDFIAANFDPRGKLIIYGNSAGGDCALNLCRAISRCKRYYMHNGLHGWFDAIPTSEVVGETCVDLLLTVDAATGPMSGLMQRDVPPCVRHNENYYQLNARIEQEMSHGGPAIPSDPNSTTIVNEDFTMTADHYSMGWMTRDRAFANIKIEATKP